MDGQTNFLESEYELDDAKKNAVFRRIARNSLSYTFAHTLITLAATCFFVFATGFTTVKTVADGGNVVGVILTGIAAAWFAYSLWNLAKGTGSLVALSLRSDAAICKGAVDGVSSGHSVTRLYDDAIEWKMRDYDYAVHLKTLFSARTFGTCLFVRNSIAEIRYAFGTDIKSWPKLIKQHNKPLDPSGWALPDDEYWRRYALPRDAFENGLSEIERKATPAGSLKVLALSVVGLTYVLFMVGSNISLDENLLQTVLRVVLVIALMRMIPTNLWCFVRGYLRHRNGLTAMGRDVAGMTHGDTAIRIVAQGIELRRSHVRKTIRWGAIGSVEQSSGWLSLRSADTTLDIVPSSHELVEALSEAGLKIPCGPWETAQERKTWGRAA